MAITDWTPQTIAQFAAAAATKFNAQPGVQPINTDEGSSAGPLFEGTAGACAFVQNELAYIKSILRLSTIPALQDGSPNPDVDSFWEAFSILRLGGSPSIGAVTCSTPSNVITQIVVPVGVILTTEDGTQFEIIADANNSAYSAELNGYPITSGHNSVSVTVQCTTPGIIGNVAANSITIVYGTSTTPMPPAINFVTNPAAFTNGVTGESDPAYKTRGTVTVASGRAGTSLAVIAAALAVQPELIYSYGDQVNPDGSSHPGFFTLYINVANSGTAAPDSLITNVTAAVEAVRPAGISYSVNGPTIQPVTISADLSILGNFSSTQVIAAATAQWASFANSTGLQPDTSPSLLELGATYATLLRDTQINGIPCVKNVRNVLLNGSAADVSAAFGTQLVAGTATFTAA